LTDLEGHSLAPQLKKANAPRAWPAITTHNQDNHTVRSRDWRYIRYADGSEELYDMRSDENEFRNLAGVARYRPVIEEHARWLPKVNQPAVPDSGGRLLTWDGKTAVWEGEPIDPSQVEK
jgi:hypothetical protein